MWLHAIGSQRTRRIYRLITENIEIDHSSERVVLHLYSCTAGKVYVIAARSSIQKFDNDYDVIFMTYKCYI